MHLTGLNAHPCLQDAKPLCHTLTGVLYTYATRCRREEFCELRLCENTCHQLICDEDNASLAYLFERSGNIR